METCGALRAFKDSTAAPVRKELACPRECQPFMDWRAFLRPQCR